MRRRFITLMANQGGDTTAPAVTGFAATTPSASTTVAITTFTADADAAAFLITENSTPPLPGAAGWSGSAPTTFAVSGSTGSYTLYPWVKDAAENVSSAYGSPVTVLVLVSALWHDFSDLSTLYQTGDTSTPVTADGQTIGYVLDKSGNNRHSSQATAGSRPLYKINIVGSLSVARFDGSDDWITPGYTTGTAANHSIYIVANRTNVGQASYRGIYCSGTVQMVVRFLTAGDKWGTYSATEQPANTQIPITTFKIFEMVRGASGNGAFYLNGTADGVYDGSSASGRNHIGGQSGQESTMQAAEILHFATAHTDPVRQAIEDYLDAKWINP
jgi:hypothetical protein